MAICKTSDRYFYSPRLTHHELRILSALSTQAMKLEAHAIACFIAEVVSDELLRRSQSLDGEPKEFQPWEFPPLSPGDTAKSLKWLQCIVDSDWFWQQSDGVQEFLDYALIHVRGLVAAWLERTPAPFKTKIELCRPKCNS